MLKEFNKAKHSGPIMGNWGNVSWKNAYSLRIKKILYGVQWEKKNVYAVKTWNAHSLNDERNPWVNGISFFEIV